MRRNVLTEVFAESFQSLNESYGGVVIEHVLIFDE